jgi:hypothetical protein
MKRAPLRPRKSDPIYRREIGMRRVRRANRVGIYLSMAINKARFAK